MFFVSITPLMKMALDSLTIALATSNLELLYDVEILLSLVCLVPMLEILNALVTFAQLCDIFVCDFVATMKICQDDLNKLYVDPVLAFIGNLS
jgi:hypothetical protein